MASASKSARRASGSACTIDSPKPRWPSELASQFLSENLGAGACNVPIRQVEHSQPGEAAGCVRLDQDDKKTALSRCVLPTYWRGGMQAISDYFQSPMGMIINAVLLIALIGVYLYLKNRPSED